MNIHIIYLNGPSSSGKTTLAKALQDQLEEPFLHVSMDKIIGWMPDKMNDWVGGEALLGYSWKQGQDPHGYPTYKLQVGPFARKMGATFKAIILTLANMGHYLIIDDVSFGQEEVDQWRKILKNFPTIYIGVNAPLSILEEREKKRGNRMLGSSRDQFYTVHQDVIYDLNIDTHHASLQDNLEKILSQVLLK